MTQRFALYLSDQGRRWVTTVEDTGHPPKTAYHDGRMFALVMTMAMEHHEFADAWAVGYAPSVYAARTTR